jgi:aromatic-L-amino-acid/L-tryptophan decarboxylase
MDVSALRRQIEADTAEGDVPFLVEGTAGSVSTDAVDPLPEISAICKEYSLWFHVDGAYGGCGSRSPDAR